MPRPLRIPRGLTVSSALDGRERRSARSREAIVQALFGLIGSGVLRPTAQQVAERAGVGIRSVFRHFADMESLFAEMNARLQAEALPILRSETVAGGVDRRARALVEGIRDVLNDAIAAGGSSLRDHKRTNGELGLFQHHFAVYDREGERCPRRGCGGTIKRIVQSGRSTFFCPVCQR